LASIINTKIAVPLSSVKDGITVFNYRFQEPDLHFGEGQRFPNEIVVNVTVTGMGSDILLSTKVTSEALIVCDRCCSDFKYLINNEVKSLYTYDIEKYKEDTDDEIKYLHGSMQEIDIVPEIIDALSLAIPTKCLCNESCKGLCVICGENLNIKKCDCENNEIDPRWNGLKNIKFED